MIRVRRNLLHLSQNRLAELVGVTQRQIGRYESGEQSPSLAVSVRLADALQVSLAELAGAETAGADLSGEWWVAWQYRGHDGGDQVNTHPLVLMQDGKILRSAGDVRAFAVGDGSYTWRSELQQWGSEVLMGWYSMSGGSIRHIGALYFALHPDGSQMMGSWTGLKPTGSLACGCSAIARHKRDAIQLARTLIDTNGERPIWPERTTQSSS